ncbi:hypothetical protein [Longimicrobium terrae]|uniref:Uncharacterized protein n=1 Tax=Longimicrobium terrae TaxID=1639882 RepID=A0A841H6T8_9BACT|nr:hypothetical protein [Longimicrobium terrae]MBB4638219.1 hypothetical protein [Longimicrobium terrae]MBB6073622.1 hypothetical protein [Longimicrobium terrae]NNC30303.1 hypothetical protein [Longimicrobium terrae]
MTNTTSSPAEPRSPQQRTQEIVQRARDIIDRTRDLIRRTQSTLAEQERDTPPSGE